MSSLKLINRLKYFIVVVIILIIGAFLLHKLLSNYTAFERQKIEAQLQNAHNNKIIRAKAAIDVYATLVSSIKSYTINTSSFPTEKKLQKYLNDLLQEIKFKDSILINYINTDHVFQYVVTPTELDPKKLKGISVKAFRSKEVIDELDSLMQTSNIKLFSPVNLREGWAGFPFNFSAINEKNEVIGYMSPILNVKYLLDYFYTNNSQDTYVHKFLVNDSLDLTREAIYNNTEIYNKARDKEYYKNFNIEESDFIYTNIQLFGLNLKVGSAYKNKPLINTNINAIAYIWYVLLSFMVLISRRQYFKIRVLNRDLKQVNNIVSDKNKELESSLYKIETLIKEIHHRIKNNMQMVAGILLLQEEEYDDENIKKALRDSQNRIQSMSLVHEKLYNNTTLKEVKIKDYVVQLIDFVEDTIKNKTMQLRKLISINEAIIFDADTTSNLGLIINELITNSFKYAFKTDQENSLSIEIVKEGAFYKLTYKDNGAGLPDDFNIKKSESLGMQLIDILTEQLSGSLEYTKKPESTFTIYFKPLIESLSS
ncbi:sensor histidine kinase [Lacinutrix sp. C3R15]|uniref:sensor histidine kinase n=1 Tax=Flavobacteriaceae TaxID=49546 RepID=UPI001C0A3AD1|nr:MULTISPECIES: sensor histidine kinase [Flavobacteriaceae]MBU2938719.1 sensor histidine kinase [Lacinutrix sp. C3R15]MDO6622032.1 sensor histidine kinase [Oceanihabitans sp. 1_MG-2023]